MFVIGDRVVLGMERVSNQLVPILGTVVETEIEEGVSLAKLVKLDSGASWHRPANIKLAEVA